MILLVTGATGFVGRSVLDRLHGSDVVVHALSRRPLPATSSVEWHVGDMLAPAGIQDVLEKVRPTHLMHLAWTASPGTLWEDPDNVLWAEATLRTLRQFAAVGGRRALVTGSCAEYAWSDSALDEATSPCNPISLYGASKLGTNVIGTAALRRLSVSFVWARLFMLFGPGEHPDRVVPAAIRQLDGNGTFQCNDGSRVRDYLYVADAADALVRLLRSDMQGNVNVASGRRLTMRHLLETIAELCDTDGRTVFGARPPSATDPQAILARTRRLQDELVWAPCTSLESAVRCTIDDFRRTRPLTNGKLS